VVLSNEWYRGGNKNKKREDEGKGEKTWIRGKGKLKVMGDPCKRGVGKKKGKVPKSQGAGVFPGGESWGA